MTTAALKLACNGAFAVRVRRHPCERGAMRSVTGPWRSVGFAAVPCSLLALLGFAHGMKTRIGVHPDIFAPR
jgi:hypothetical protein